MPCFSYFNIYRKFAKLLFIVYSQRHSWSVKNLLGNCFIFFLGSIRLQFPLMAYRRWQRHRQNSHLATSEGSGTIHFYCIAGVNDTGDYYRRRWNSGNNSSPTMCHWPAGIAVTAGALSNPGNASSPMSMTRAGPRKKDFEIFLKMDWYRSWFYWFRILE